MSLQVNDPRSRTRSKSPGRERSRSRDSRVSHRSHSPAVEAPRTKGYNPEEEAEIERQYKLISEERRRETDEPRLLASRAPRSPARYDVNRSDSDSESRRRGADSSRRRRDDRYEHSDSERGSAAASSRSHRRRPSPDRGSRVNHDSDSADDLAYGDAPGNHPSYARPNRYSYTQPTQFAPTAPRPGYPAAPIDWASVPECERPGYVPPSSQPTGPATMPGAFPAVSGYPPSSGSVPAPVIASQYPGFPQQAYATSAGYAPAHYRTASATDTGYPLAAGYANPGVYQYAQVDPNVKYTSKTEKPASAYAAPTHEQYSRPLPQQLQNQYYPQSQQKPPQPPPQTPDQSHRHKNEPEFVEIAPGGSRSSARPHSQSVSSNTLAVAGASAAHSAHPPG
ncbi:Annexin [Penicillium coprophilum]|uniref:Annexin n=1 Tax=Penicillium coprophilum TaxID=36646 RepID=UPI00238F2055|nr:Annexin [Penicillium coprophilum]KAJ5154598.1 Annexin [Penicillium coprophilum]